MSYALKRRWKDGTTHIVLSPQVLIERLLALVPRPRKHQLTYYGVLAPAAAVAGARGPPGDAAWWGT